MERSASQLFGHVGVSHIRCELEMCRKADVITEEPEFQSGMVKAINLKVKAGIGIKPKLLDQNSGVFVCRRVLELNQNENRDRDQKIDRIFRRV